MFVGIVFFGNLSFERYPIFTNILFFIAPLVSLIGIVRLLLTPSISKAIVEKHKLALLEYEKKQMCLRCGAFYFTTDKPDVLEPTTSVATNLSPVLKLNAAVAKILAQQDFKTQLARDGLDPAGGTPESFDNYFRAEVEKQGAVIRASGARAE